VSSLWTPSGEHRVEHEPGEQKSPDPQTPGRAAPEAEAGAGAGYDEETLDEVRRQLLGAPVEVVIGNHAYGLFELAAIHLSARPPNLEQARLAVDALAAIVEGLEGRLGQVEASLREALAQIRLAYVQIGSSAGAGEDGPPG
jgi:hypothetical protein